MPTLTSTTSFEFGAEPRSTSSIAPGQPTDNSGPGQNVASNPSLILAFLALSFFTMAMIFIFGFRRYQYLQERLHEVFGRPGADPRRPSEQQTPGEVLRLRRLPLRKPQLWEVCTDASVRWKARGKKVGDALWSWDNVMPLSASTVANAGESGTVPLRPACPNPRPGSSNVFQRFWRFGVAPLLTHSSGRSVKHSESIMALLPMSRLRLAVLVAMPSERYPIYDKELYEDKLRHERGTVGYELGLYEVPWDGDDAA